MLNSLLVQIEDIANGNSELKKKLTYSILRRGSKNLTATKIPLKLNKVDEDTRTLLETEKGQWYDNPSSFWDQGQSQDFNFRTEAQIVYYYRRRLRDDA